MSESDIEEPKSAAAKLFDIRVLIGGLFVVYGVLLTVAGLFSSDEEIDKADGLNINLWLGLGMFVLGVLFLIWRAVNPIKPPESTDEKAEPRHAKH